MRVKAQMGMVMNLDKCIGCHTCSVTCKNVWTNRSGAEYMWFNDVETKPGQGYPKRWEDQDRWRGGWELTRGGTLRLRSGPRARRLANIFFNPDLPELGDYYEPFTYRYGDLFDAGPQKHQPVARPISQVTGQDMSIEWGPNWEDDLAGGPTNGPQDPNMQGLEEAVRMEYEQVFMMYLPRICEHCLNPSCVASCPSGAMYKRDEDGIVLVDQDACRGWRMCVSSCPYKKVYFNWESGKAEKCTLCYPRLEAGMTTICSETCVGRIRYVGVVLYDADKVEAAAATPDEHDLLDAQLEVFLDPEDPQVRADALAAGIPEDWVDAAVRSPIWKLAMKHRVALPLHPEYRTLPMVWYVPPLSPVMNMIEGEGAEADPDDVFPAIDDLRIPVQFLANLLSAGDETVIRDTLKRLAAMRSYMRTKTVGGQPDPALAEAVGMTAHEVEEMYRLLGLAKSIDRFVIPTTHAEIGGLLDEQQGACGFTDPAGPGPCGALETAEYGERVSAFHLGTRDGVSAAVAHTTAPGAGDAAPVPGAEPAPSGGGCGSGGCACGGKEPPPPAFGTPAPGVA